MAVDWGQCQLTSVACVYIGIEEMYLGVYCVCMLMVHGILVKELCLHVYMQDLPASGLYSKQFSFSKPVFGEKTGVMQDRISLAVSFCTWTHADEETSLFYPQVSHCPVLSSALHCVQCHTVPSLSLKGILVVAA